MGDRKEGQKTLENISAALCFVQISCEHCPFCGRERTVNRIEDTLQILQNREEHGQHSGTHEHGERGSIFIAKGNCTCLSVR